MKGDSGSFCPTPGGGVSSKARRAIAAENIMRISETGQGLRQQGKIGAIQRFVLYLIDLKQRGGWECLALERVS
jgi:hypothetical protein